MSEELQPEPNLAGPPKRPGPRRRGYRGGRGRRRPVPGVPVPETPAENELSSAGPPIVSQEKFPRHFSERREERAGSAISEAVAEVTQVVESLKQSLAQMEEVLELVELAERQKTADEQEIESLRRALHRLQRPAR